MKKILLMASLVAASIAAQAQGNPVPDDYKLVAPADYARYEKNVIPTIDYLLNAAPDPNSMEQKKATAFLINWVSGSPDVSIDIQPEIVNFFEKNKDLLTVFMAGWTKYALQTQKFDDALNGNIEGVKAVTAYYQKNKALMTPDENVEQYIKMQKDNTLAAFIKKQIE
jgi:hypothetical protein